MGNIRPFAFTVAAIILSALIMRRRYASPVKPLALRNDAAGLGHFGAPRGSRTHQGIDYLTEPGQSVFSPVTGRFIRTGRPYATDARYSLAVIHGGGLEFKLMYVEPLPGLTPGTPVRAGQKIGTAQNVTAKYGGPMRNHLHLEVRRIAGAELLDPGTLFG